MIRCGNVGPVRVRYDMVRYGEVYSIVSKYFTLDEIPSLRFLWFSRLPLDIWLPLKQWVYRRDKGICQYCQNPFPYEKTHCHHTLELCEGGSNHPSNLKTLCHNCHRLRHPFMK